MNPPRIKNLEGFEIRPLQKAEILAVHQIESEVYRDPWSIHLFYESLDATMTYFRGLFQNDSLVGYAIYQVVFTEAHLLNFAITQDLQRRGLGRLFLDRVMSHAFQLGGLSFFLEVRPSNDSARAMYEKKGFKILMVRENYYSDNESALIMVKDLVPPKGSG